MAGAVLFGACRGETVAAAVILFRGLGVGGAGGVFIVDGGTGCPRPQLSSSCVPLRSEEDRGGAGRGPGQADRQFPPVVPAVGAVSATHHRSRRSCAVVGARPAAATRLLLAVHTGLTGALKDPFIAVRVASCHHIDDPVGSGVGLFFGNRQGGKRSPPSQGEAVAVLLGVVRRPQSMPLLADSVGPGALAGSSVALTGWRGGAALVAGRTASALAGLALGLAAAHTRPMKSASLGSYYSTRGGGEVHGPARRWRGRALRAQLQQRLTPTPTPPGGSRPPNRWAATPAAGWQL